MTIEINHYLHLIKKILDLTTSLRDKLQEIIVKDVLIKKRYYALTDKLLIEIINLIIENTKAIGLLVENNFTFQVPLILRNSTEILTRCVIQAVHYQYVKFEPSKRDNIDIADKSKINDFLRTIGKIGKKGENAENVAFNFLKEMFPNEENPFSDLIDQLPKVYGELCSYSHPEKQLKFRLDSFIKECNEEYYEINIPLIGGSSKRIYNHDKNNFQYLFQLNILIITMIARLFHNIISEENDKSFKQELVLAYNEFNKLYQN